MRLLDTHTGFFREFTGPKDPELVKCGGYVILSHTWGPDEQSYEDLLRLQANARDRAANWVTHFPLAGLAPDAVVRVSDLSKLWDALKCAPPPPHDKSSQRTTALSILNNSGTPLDKVSGSKDLDTRLRKRGRLFSFNADSDSASTDTGTTEDSTPLSILDDPELSPKIKGLCKTAREGGYRYAWDDTCCIDKTSSAELSQAINSMYEWYREARRCYVYLADVPDGDDPKKPDSAFKRSRWHTRGWTLQELLAPRYWRVRFYSSTWTYIGDREDLANALERITGIDAGVLTDHVSVHSVPVARRMGWASKRKTSRVEDEAYCLLGIFGIHMSPIYGEGRNAFIRLQQEIMRTIPDQTIFAWGLPGEIHTMDDYCLAPALSSHLLSSEDGLIPNNGLLALSPGDFRYSGDLVPISTVQLFDRLAWKPKDSDFPLRPLQYTFAADGVHVSLPCVDISAAPELCRTLRQIPQTLPPSIAISNSGRQTRCSAAHCNIRSLAVLLCQAPGNHLVALPLRSPLTTADAGLAVGLHCNRCLESDIQLSRVLYLSDPVIQAVARLIRVPNDICVRQGNTEEPPPRDVPELTQYDDVEDQYTILRIEGEYRCSEVGCLITCRSRKFCLLNKQTQDTLRGRLSREEGWSASLVPAHPPPGAAFSLEHSERIDISVHVLQPGLYTPVIRPGSGAWHRARITVSNYTRNRAVASPPDVPTAMAPGEGSTVASDARTSKDADVPSDALSETPAGGSGALDELSCEQQSCDVLFGMDGRFRCAFDLRLADDPTSTDDSVERAISSVESASAQEQELADHDGFSLWTLHVSSTIRRRSTDPQDWEYGLAILVLKLELSPADNTRLRMHLEKPPQPISAK